MIFPEAYPTIDPVYTPKQSIDDFLSFRPGFARLVELAERDGTCRVAIIPTGLFYQREDRWRITLRFGPPLFRENYANQDQLIHAVEERVRSLSAPVATCAALDAEEVIGR